MPLAKYHAKRNFKITSEPKGAEKKSSEASHSFVVQKHQASHLHYDFRLEWDGVLRSWAVPKGPSLDPSVKRLAMEVEDHPLEYGGFEGIIPEGQYGGGTVMVWDRGTWEPEEETPDVGAALKKGELKFTLKGSKLKGSWVLVRTKGFGSKPSWLLIKHRDKYASDTDIATEKPRSVLSRRLMAAIAAAAGGNVEKAAKADRRRRNDMPAIVWKGYISFGLVSFPVRLHTAGRSESIHFHMLHKKDLSRVKEVWYCAKENKPIQRSDIVKGYETSKDEYLVIEDEELKAVAPATASTMEIVQFVKEAEVDPIYFEHSYYVAPADEVTKPYALFLKALEESGHHAIAKVAMHGREHVVLIRPDKEGMVLHTLFYENELHAANKHSIPAKVAATKKEVELATQLIKQLSAPFKPEQFHDTYRENVEKLVEQKSKGEPVKKEHKARKAPVIDLMEALKKSLSKTEKTKPTRKGKAA